MKEPMWKNIVILFTGGLDSTYLLYKNLKEGNHVYLVYTKIENNTNKTKSELHVIDEIIVEMNRLFSPCNITIKYNSVDIYSNSGGIRFKQLPAHLLSMIYSIDDLQSEIQLGYCMNDDMISYIEDFKLLYESYMPFCAKGMPELTFPLMKIAKWQMLDELPQSLKDLVFSCEEPQDLCKPCGSCDSCKKYEYLSTSYGYHVFKGTRLVRQKTMSDDDVWLEKAETPKEKERHLLINTRRITISKPSLNLARSLSDSDEENESVCQ